MSRRTELSTADLAWRSGAFWLACLLVLHAAFPIAFAGGTTSIDLAGEQPAPAPVPETGVKIGLAPVLRVDDIAHTVRKPDTDLRKLPDGSLPSLIGVRYSLSGKVVEYFVSPQPPQELVRDALAHELRGLGLSVIMLPELPMRQDGEIISALKSLEGDLSPDYALLCVLHALSFDVGPFKKGYSSRIRFMTRPFIRIEMTLIDMTKGRLAWHGFVNHQYESFGSPYEAAGPAEAVALIREAFADFVAATVRNNEPLRQALAR